MARTEFSTKKGTFVFDDELEVGGTSLHGMFNSPFGFEETIARLITLSGQDPVKSNHYNINDGSVTDGKVSVEFIGLFNGARFTLYDYKGDRQLHIGGSYLGMRLDVQQFNAALSYALYTVRPTAFVAKRADHYADDDAPVTYGWSPADDLVVSLAPEESRPSNQAAIDFGIKLARRIFDKRKARVEVHINAVHLSAAIALGFEAGVAHAKKGGVK